ncbi:MAG: alpha/beta hydrolase [Clostridia bacterium]|nr:alpha/beta hydrolase [Clostridia bacterium]
MKKACQKKKTDTKKAIRAFAKKAGRVAAGSGLVLGGLALATGALYTEIMTSVIARRRTAGTDAIITLAMGGAPDSHDPIYDEWAEALRNTPTQTVAIRSRENYVLRGRWYPAENAKRIVILVHGWHSCWDLDFSGSAPFLHKEGCSLLLIDQRCHGESGGDLISYGIKEKDDVLLWLEWVERTHPGLPVYLCGVSMGAATVLMAAGESLSGRVRGVIADCGYSSPTPVIKGTLTHTLGKWGTPTYMAIDLNCRRRGGFSLSESSPAQALKKNTDIPCLFFHGDADPLVPWTMSLENYRACRAPKELVVVHGAGHAMSYIVEPGLYREKLCAFFEANDPPPTPKRRRFGRRKENAS